MTFPADRRAVDAIFRTYLEKIDRAIICLKGQINTRQRISKDLEHEEFSREPRLLMPQCTSCRFAARLNAIKSFKQAPLCWKAGELSRRPGVLLVPQIRVGTIVVVMTTIAITKTITMTIARTRAVI